MAGLQLTGLVSGFDWGSFVDSMIDAQRTPITRLQSEKTVNTTKIGIFDNLATKMTDLQTAAKALQSDSLFTSRTVKSATAGSTWSLSSSSSTPVGTYAVAVSKLATASARIGNADVGAGLSTSSDVSGLTLASLPTATPVKAGVFTVNGAQVTVDLADSLQDVFDKISTATSGAVTASYDATTDKIALNSGSAITLGASNDTSNFLAATKLGNNGTGTIQSNSTLGTVALNSPLKDARLRSPITAVDADGNGTFTINGVNISYNANTDSLNTIMSRISSSTAGVSASYDSVNDRVTFTNKTTGDLGLNLTEATGGLFDALGIRAAATTFGQNAEFTVNGGPTLTSASNTFDSSSHGIAGLSVAANSQTTETITVGSDTAAPRKAIDEFVTKFNAIQSYIDDQTKVSVANGKVSSALMSNNREIQSWASTMRSKVFEEVSGLTGTIKRLEHMGIDFATGTGAAQLVVKDGAKLDAAIRDNPSDIQAFFSSSTTGFASKIQSFATTILGTGTSSSGLINSQKNSLTAQNTGIDKQIADIERRLTSEKERMEAAFIAMEQAQSYANQMQSQLTNAFGSGSKSK